MTYKTQNISEGIDWKPDTIKQDRSPYNMPFDPLKGLIWLKNYLFALITILGSTFYCIGGLLTLKLKNKVNENVTTSTTLWSVIFLLPLSIIFEAPWNANPSLESTLSLLYLEEVCEIFQSDL